MHSAKRQKSRNVSHAMVARVRRPDDSRRGAAAQGLAMSDSKSHGSDREAITFGRFGDFRARAVTLLPDPPNLTMPGLAALEEHCWRDPPASSSAESVRSLRVALLVISVLIGV